MAAAEASDDWLPRRRKPPRNHDACSFELPAQAALIYFCYFYSCYFFLLKVVVDIGQLMVGDRAYKAWQQAQV